MKNIEYDRFGPWIYEIKGIDTIPPLFLSYIYPDEDKSNCLLKIKIPRQIERRNATPDMNLYDYLISFHKKEIQILQRKNDSVIEKKMYYSSVKTIIIRESLLKGELKLILQNETISIPYNTVSNDIIHKCVQLMRNKYTPEKIIKNNREEADFSDANFFFQGLYNKMKSKYPDEKLISFQKEISFFESGDNFFRKIINKIINRTLLQHLHFFNGNELTILKRVKNFNTRLDSQYGFEEIHIPLNSIDAIKWVDDTRHSELLNEVIILGKEQITIPFGRNNEGIDVIKSIIS